MSTPDTLTATIDDLLSWDPYYPEAQIRAWAGGAETFTALDVLRHPDVSAEDKLWTVLREELIDPLTLRLFACDCAEQALSLVREPDPRSVEAVRVARLYAIGEASAAELADAKKAAQAAARAAWEAARAAWEAARAAEAAAGEWQVERLIERLEAL